MALFLLVYCVGRLGLVKSGEQIAGVIADLISTSRIIYASEFDPL